MPVGNLFFWKKLVLNAFFWFSSKYLLGNDIFAHISSNEESGLHWEALVQSNSKSIGIWDVFWPGRWCTLWNCFPFDLYFTFYVYSIIRDRVEWNEIKKKNTRKLMTLDDSSNKCLFIWSRRFRPSLRRLLFISSGSIIRKSTNERNASGTWLNLEEKWN